MARELPSLDALTVFYSCDPDEGVVRLKVSRSTSRAGKEYRSLDKNGYVVVHPTIDGVRHHLFAHRLAWALYYGAHPPRDMMIDHINRNRTDNRKQNLRLVDSYGNAQNSAHTRKPAHIPRNVSLINQNGKKRYQVSRCENNKVRYLGIYDSLELASSVAKRGSI